MDRRGSFGVKRPRSDDGTATIEETVPKRSDSRADDASELAETAPSHLGGDGNLPENGVPASPSSAAAADRAGIRNEVWFSVGLRVVSVFILCEITSAKGFGLVCLFEFVAIARMHHRDSLLPARNPKLNCKSVMICVCTHLQASTIACHSENHAQDSSTPGATSLSDTLSATAVFSSALPHLTHVIQSSRAHDAGSFGEYPVKIQMLVLISHNHHISRRVCECRHVGLPPV